MGWELEIMTQKCSTRNARPEKVGQKCSLKNARSEIAVAVDDRRARLGRVGPLTAEVLEQIKDDATRVAKLLGFELRDEDIIDCVSVQDPDQVAPADYETVIHRSQRFDGMVQRGAPVPHRIPLRKVLEESSAQQRETRLLALAESHEDPRVRRAAKKLQGAVEAQDQRSVAWWCDRIDHMLGSEG